jgi:hypothetical protein
VRVQDEQAGQFVDGVVPIVGLLAARVAREVQLLQEAHVLQRRQNLVQVAQVVVGEVQQLQEAQRLDGRPA